MKRVRIVCAEAAAATLAAPLRAAGYEVAAGPIRSKDDARALRADPPDAVVIDLARAPSTGSDIALALRLAAPTRAIPIVMAGGDPAKVAAMRKHLPGAAFAGHAGLPAAVARAIARPARPVPKPASALAGYSGTPLPKKLGIKPGSVVALEAAPRGFEAVLGELPEGARTRRGGAAAPDLTLWFVRSRRELEAGVVRMAPRAGSGGLWIVWPKKTSAIAGDVGEGDVRAAGLAAGLVDFKVCAVDATWSGLRFSRKRPD